MLNCQVIFQLHITHFSPTTDHAKRKGVARLTSLTKRRSHRALPSIRISTLVPIPSRSTSRRPSGRYGIPISVSDDAGPALERVGVVTAAGRLDGFEEDFVRTPFEAAHELVFGSVVHVYGLHGLDRDVGYGGDKDWDGLSVGRYGQGTGLDMTMVVLPDQVNQGRVFRSSKCCSNVWVF